MADDSIEVKIVIDAEGAIKAFDELGNEVKDFGRKLQQNESPLSKTQASIITLESAVNLGKMAFSAARQAFAELAQALERAAAVEGLATSFEGLQQSIGRTAETALPKLQTATKGLISDFDLMQASNKAVSLGVDDGSGKFEALAAAAIKLGRAMGQDASKSLDDVTTALAKGSVEILGNLGVTLKLEDAYAKYSEQLGKTAESLTELEKKEAVRVVGAQKVIEHSQKLAEVQETAALAFSKVQVAAINLYDEFATGISSSTALAEAFGMTAESLSEIDAATVGKALGDMAAIVINQVIPAFERGKNKIAEYIAMYNSFNLALDRLVPNTSALKILTEIDAALKKNSREGAKEAGVAFERLNMIFEGNTRTMQKYAGVANILIGIAEKQIETLKARTVLEDIARIDKEEAIKINKELIAIEQKKAEQDAKNVEAAKKHQEMVDGLTKSLKAVVPTIDSELLPKLQDLYQAYTDGEMSGEDYEKALVAMGTSYSTTAEKAEIFKETLKAGVGTVDANTQALEKLEEQAGQTAQALNQTIGQGLGSVLNAAITGGDIGLAINSMLGDIGSNMGSQLGQELGASLGGAAGSILGPVGAAVGSGIGSLMGEEISKGLEQLKGGKRDVSKGITKLLIPSDMFMGNVIGDFISKALFGGGDPEREAREAFERFIQDAVDYLDKPGTFKLNIDGVLQSFGKIFDTKYYEGFFENLDTSTEESLQKFRGFESIGQVFSRVFADSGIAAEQFGAILGNNLGGSLNNLQLLVQKLDISQDQMFAVMENGFLDGEVSAEDYLTALGQIENLYKKGIPDAVGATDKAFQNFIGSAGNGRIAMDALQDAAAEAAEAGITNFEDLRSSLIAAGASVEDVDKYFLALEKAGVTNMQELADVSAATTAAIIVNWEALGGKFDEPLQKVEELQNKLDNLTEEKDVTINVRYNIIGPVPKGLDDDNIGGSGQGLSND